MLSKRLSASIIPVDPVLNAHLLRRMEEGSESVAESFPKGVF